MERKRSQENVEKQKGWRLVEMKEDGSDFCFVCLSNGAISL
jgi:hypothetical protein